MVMSLNTRGVDRERRRFLGAAAMTLAAARLRGFSSAEESDTMSRELTAIGNAAQWINSPRLSASDFAGKVVLVDFWTYTCINWLRTLPYIRAWSQKYRQGLIVIGVHTPEFGFEREIDNVRRAVREMHIDYPVAIDNDYAIWRAFNNEFWPALYFIDAHGRLREHHFGEGEYVRSETTIQRLLTETGAAASPSDFVAVDASGLEAPADFERLRSPENYVGAGRTVNFASVGGAEPGRRHLYVAPAHLGLNEWSLAGEWTIGKETTVLNAPNGRMVYRFHARDLHLVMAPPEQGGQVRFRVSIDGRAPGAAHGVDVDSDGAGTVIAPRLYQLIRQPNPIVDRSFEIEFLDAGVQTFAFTFG